MSNWVLQQMEEERHRNTVWFIQHHGYEVTALVILAAFLWMNRGWITERWQQRQVKPHIRVEITWQDEDYYVLRVWKVWSGSPRADKLLHIETLPEGLSQMEIEHYKFRQLRLYSIKEGIASWPY